MSQRMTRLTMAVALSVALASPALAQGAEITPVLEGGLNAPRGLAIGPGGTLYVAEAGAGSEDNCVPHAELVQLCYAATGSITTVTDGVPTRIIEGLTSGLDPDGAVVGPSDVAVDEMGNVWFTVGLAGSAEFRESIPGGFGEQAGMVFKADGEGGFAAVADLVAFESTENPDAEQPGNAEPDSNPNSILLTADGAIIADAGGNTLVQTDAAGNVSAIAVFPVTMQEFQPPEAPEAQMIPMDPVPTSVVADADGALYVGTLTGFPFPKGGASVWKVIAGEEPTVYASGFTNIMDVAFGPDGTLYVLEISHEGLAAPAEGPPMGGLWSVPPGGGDPVLITNEGLILPGGIAVDADGTIFITTCAICPPGAGGIVSIQP